MAPDSFGSSGAFASKFKHFQPYFHSNFSKTCQYWQKEQLELIWPYFYQLKTTEYKYGPEVCNESSSYGRLAHGLIHFPWNRNFYICFPGNHAMFWSSAVLSTGCMHGGTTDQKNVLIVWCATELPWSLSLLLKVFICSGKDTNS